MPLNTSMQYRTTTDLFYLKHRESIRVRIQKLLKNWCEVLVLYVRGSIL